VLQNSELIVYSLKRNVGQSRDIASAFEGLKARAEALYTIADPLVNTHRLRINTFALAAHLPTMFGQRE
jgi:putative ABC transport system substrate-binding protein